MRIVNVKRNLLFGRNFWRQFKNLFATGFRVAIGLQPRDRGKLLVSWRDVIIGTYLHAPHRWSEAFG